MLVQFPALRLPKLNLWYYDWLRNSPLSRVPVVRNL